MAPPGSGPMPQISSSMSVAFGPEGGMAVWRVGFGAIWGVPLNREGIPTGPARLILSDVLGTSSPAVEYFGGSFMLWWMNGYPALARTARLESDGTVIETKTLPVGATPAASNSRLTLAFGNSGEYLGIQFFDAGGALVRSAPLIGVGRTYHARAVALVDGSFAVVTTDWSGLFLARFSAEGEQLGSPLLIEASRGTTSTDYKPLAAAVATDGSSLFVVWTAGAYDQLPELKSVIVARDNVLSSQQTLDSRQWKSIVSLEAQWADGFYTVAVAAGQWGESLETDDLDLYAARFSATGQIASNSFVPVVKRPGLETQMTMRTSNGKHLLFFHQGDYGMNELFVAALPANGSLLRFDPSAVDARLSDSAAWQKWSVAASDGSGWLVVWLEQLANREEIRSAPLRPDGTSAAPPTTLATAFRYLGMPAVAFNGIDYVVSWNQGRALLAKRILRDGTAIDAVPLVIATDTGAFGAPAIAASDGLTLLAWESGGVRAALLHADGRTTQPVLVSPPPREEQHASISYEAPVVAGGRDTFLVAFQERRTQFCVGIPCPTTTQARARIVARDGVLRGALMEFDEAAPSSAAATGGTYLLLFNASARAVILDEPAAQVVRTLSLPLSGNSLVKAFAAAGEYILVSRVTISSLLLLCLSPDGVMCGIRRAETFALPAAVSGAGSLLVAVPVATRGAPYFGAPAVLAQVVDSFRPVSTLGRRRAVRR